MGTINHGEKPSYDITLSKGDVAPRRVNPTTSETSRSFAQPAPTAPPAAVVPKVHASEDAKTEAIKKNSQLRQEAKMEEKKIPPSSTPKVEKKEEKQLEKKEDKAAPVKKTEGRQRTNGALPENDSE